MSKEEEGEELWPSPLVGWAWVAILVLAYVCAYVDRQILSLMVDRVKDDLNITDSQFGLLHGLSFAMLYCTAGLPLGSVVDRYPRRTIIIWGLSVWSVMTALCGLSRQYYQLFLARVGVGVGEATLSPSAYSLLSDCFDKRRLRLALSVYMAGAGVGAGLAFMLGGALIGFVDSFAPVTLPLFGEAKTWQIVFLVVALPGFPIAMLFLLFSEPLRKGRIAVEVPGWGTVLGYFWQRRRFMLPFFAGLSCIVGVSLGGLSWFAAVLMRSYGLNATQVGFQLGLVSLTAIPLGFLSGAWLSHILDRKGLRDPTLLIAVWGSAAMIGATGLLSVDNESVTLLAMFLSLTLATLPIGIAIATLQTMVPNEMRGRAGALLLFCQNGVGMVLGPLLPGVLTDWAFGGNPVMIRSALSISSVGFSVSATILLFVAYRSLARPETNAMVCR